MNITISPAAPKRVTLHPSAPLAKGPNWNLLSGSTTPDVAPDGLSANFANSDPNGGQTIVAISGVDANGQVVGFILLVDVLAPVVPPPAATLDPTAA